MRGYYYMQLLSGDLDSPEELITLEEAREYCAEYEVKARLFDSAGCPIFWIDSYGNYKAV